MDKLKSPLLWLGVSGSTAAGVAITDDRQPTLGFTLLGASLIVLGIWVAIEVRHHS